MILALHTSFNKKTCGNSYWFVQFQTEKEIEDLKEELRKKLGKPGPKRDEDRSS